MAFNFSNGVPKFPAAVKSDSRASKATFDNQINDREIHPLAALPREDQDLITQLVLHSGSLKDLASTYEVSYPTIRNRLDRVIERLRVIVARRRPNGVSELLAQMVERGEIAPGAARQIDETVRKQMESLIAVATQ